MKISKQNLLKMQLKSVDFQKWVLFLFVFVFENNFSGIKVIAEY